MPVCSLKLQRINDEKKLYMGVKHTKANDLHLFFKTNNFFFVLVQLKG